ncbi:MAG: glycosyltransferase [Muribaculaceae bacterium]|nr:glycosyltransferase [Muribaculaceae bacterium]
MYAFTLDISLSALILYVVAGVLIIIYVFIGLRPLWKVTNAIRRSREDITVLSRNRPVSIIVFASDQADGLKRLLPVLLTQNYDAPYEVIVVNDGESDSTVEIVERLRLQHDNLYLTYTPDGARQLSRKKLALTIGIKAAHYPVVIQTIASAVIKSPDWLARMTEPFNDGTTEIVLGLSYLSHEDDHGMTKTFRTFNSAADTLAWVWSAMCRRPYRGTELNLAYTRDVFFRNRGFSRSLNLKYGDDDIFVSEIAHKENTAIVVHPDAMVQYKNYNIGHAFRNLRDRYYFTGRKISHRSRRLMAVASWLVWGVVALCVVAAILMWPNLTWTVVSAFVILSLLIVSAVLWRKTVSLLSLQKLSLTLPIAVMTRPFANIIASVKALAHRRHNYTWVK